MSNKVYIATSVDGYISDKNNSLDWLPNQDGEDLGYEKFIDSIDALVMGKNTFETVLGFGGDWVYTKKVFVVSTSLLTIPDNLATKVELINGTPDEIIELVQKQGYKNLYIDGGKTIQGFLQYGLIDELIITTIPVLLGGGSPLFGMLESYIELEHKTTKIIKGLVQTTYIVKR